MRIWKELRTGFFDTDKQESVEKQVFDNSTQVESTELVVKICSWSQAKVGI